MPSNEVLLFMLEDRDSQNPICVYTPKIVSYQLLVPVPSDWTAPLDRQQRGPVKQQRGPVPTEHWTDSAAAGVPINSLLRAAARLDPEKLDFRLPSGLIDRTLAVDLPCFQRATSIALDLSPITLAVPAGADFPALETLSLARCSTDLDALLSCCPRLRTLRLSTASDIRVNSPSLQELVVCCETSVTRHVDIVAPALKQLAISLTAVDLSISVLAPMVEKVSWHCLYFGPRIVFGLWGLNKVQLQSAERQGEPSSLCIYACAVRPFYCSICSKL
ncbi:uncharacterized protein [Aegilops tauschii subsp. strangulata]|uniref:uncharacterized protein n=1 Tax=Aegilops tauschii subsp. strangulata TaxID=200361 RepID=UPI003CC866FC